MQLLQSCMLVEFNCYQRARWSDATYMQCRELLCRCSCSCNIYACWPCVTVTNTAAVQTCLLVECCCMIDACWTVATQPACLLTFCHSILHVCWRCASSICYTCWYGVSLSAVSADMVSHYQPYLLVWCFVISHACWCGASLYRSYLLVCCLTVGHVFWCGASL